jgi:two-component system, OmpR family, sensor histidine kinase MprB
MSFRVRLTAVAAVAVAGSVLLASAALYLVVRQQLLSRLDRSLERRWSVLAARPAGRLLGPRAASASVPYVQVVAASGAVSRPPGASSGIPVSRGVLDVAEGRRGRFFAGVSIAGTQVRVLTEPLERGLALQVGRPLTEVRETLSGLALALFLIDGAGVAVAVVLGAAVSRTALLPLARLTGTVEQVTETGALGMRIEEGNDELGRLARRFNAMLGSLDASLQAQRQLVADASHELRTPLTSLRMNLELFRRADLPAADRERLPAELIGQVDELTRIVSDLVELAREGESGALLEDLRLDTLVADAVERFAPHAAAVRFATRLQPSLVQGDRGRLDRAITNLLENAAKWSPPGGAIEVAVANGEVRVRDHGPGINPADLPFVFDRFYRSAAARGQPGSGLGLAIVRRIAELHGGTIGAEQAEGGGALLRLSLPPAE